MEKRKEAEITAYLNTICFVLAMSGGHTLMALPFGVVAIKDACIAIWLTVRKDK